MFDISWGELVLVGVVALVVIGPKELPTVLRTVGQWMTKMRRMAAEFQNQFQEAMREAEFADLKQQVESIADPARALSDLNPLDTAQKEIEQTLAETPAATPSGEPLAVEAEAATPPASEPAVPSAASEPVEPAAAEPATAPEAAGSEAAAPAAEPATPPAAGGRAA
jgi:sec-independent protein translocase protein TatB